MRHYLQRYCPIGKPFRLNKGYFSIMVENYDNDFVKKLWFVDDKDKNITPFWDFDYYSEFHPGVGDSYFWVRSMRAFRRRLRKLSKILPNGTKVILDRLYDNGYVEAKIRNNINVKESKRIIHKQMNEWIKRN